MASKEQEWGRKETVVWPPAGPVNSYAAIAICLVATGIFLYLHLLFAFTPFQRYVLRTYIKTALAGSVQSVGKYRMLSVADAAARHRPAIESDLMPGPT